MAKIDITKTTKFLDWVYGSVFSMPISMPNNHGLSSTNTIISQALDAYQSDGRWNKDEVRYVNYVLNVINSIKYENKTDVLGRYIRFCANMQLITRNETNPRELRFTLESRAIGFAIEQKLSNILWETYKYNMTGNSELYGRGDKKKTSNAAESRLNNTKKEVRFLASAYYDCEAFVLNSGVTDRDLINKQFNTMLGVWLRDCKVKRESYNKFTELLSKVKGTKYSTKEEFVELICSRLEERKITTIDENKYRASFNRFLSDCGIKIGDKLVQEALFLNTLYSIAEIQSNKTLIEQIKDRADTIGLDKMQFTGPRIVTWTDGCSHTTYGSLFSNLDKMQ